MSKRAALEIAVVCCGVMCGFGVLPALVSAIVDSIPPGWDTVGRFVLVLICLLPAYLLIVKRHLVVSLITRDEASVPYELEQKPFYARLSFWIQVIGMYYLASSVSYVSGILGLLPRGIVSRAGIAGLLWLILALVCIFKSNKIEQLIQRTSNANGQDNPHSQADP